VPFCASFRERAKKKRKTVFCCPFCGNRSVDQTLQPEETEMNPIFAICCLFALSVVAVAAGGRLSFVSSPPRRKCRRRGVAGLARAGSALMLAALLTAWALPAQAQQAWMYALGGAGGKITGQPAGQTGSHGGAGGAGGAGGINSSGTAGGRVGGQDGFDASSGGLGAFESMVGLEDHGGKGGSLIYADNIFDAGTGAVIAAPGHNSLMSTATGGLYTEGGAGGGGGGAGGRVITIIDPHASQLLSNYSSNVSRNGVIQNGNGTFTANVTGWQGGPGGKGEAESVSLMPACNSHAIGGCFNLVPLGFDQNVYGGGGGGGGGGVGLYLASDANVSMTGPVSGGAGGAGGNGASGYSGKNTDGTFVLGAGGNGGYGGAGVYMNNATLTLLSGGKITGGSGGNGGSTNNYFTDVSYDLLVPAQGANGGQGMGIIAESSHIVLQAGRQPGHLFRQRRQQPGIAGHAQAKQRAVGAERHAVGHRGHHAHEHIVI
jgi:hypothetical protein